jgi:hypothetical protein
VARPKLLKLWENAVRRKNWKATIHSSLCSKHFDEEAYQVRPGALVKLLKEDAIPTIFSFSEAKKPPRRQLLYHTAEATEVKRNFIVKEFFSIKNFQNCVIFIFQKCVIFIFQKCVIFIGIAHLARNYLDLLTNI